MTGTTVHDLVPGSAEQALSCWRAVRAAAGKRPSDAAATEAYRRLAGELLVVATGPVPGVDGYAAGRVDGDVLVLSAVEVVPAARGHGLAARMADTLADLAYAQGARRVRATGEPAQFWAALGLQPDGNHWWGVLDPPERTVVLHSGGLRLGQLLKLAGLAETGAEAKALLSEGTVRVDDEPETRRGRQLSVGNVVTVADQQIRLVPPA